MDSQRNIGDGARHLCVNTHTQTQIKWIMLFLLPPPSPSSSSSSSSPPPLLLLALLSSLLRLVMCRNGPNSS